MTEPNDGFCGALRASVAQVFLTKAYQTAPAAFNSAVSYLGPVLNLACGALFFAKVPDQRALIGAAVVLGHVERARVVLLAVEPQA